eukprot:5684115-Prymnesium_polylepis.1
MASARSIRAPTAASASATDRSPTVSGLPGPSMHEGRAGMHGRQCIATASRWQKLQCDGARAEGDQM